MLGTTPFRCQDNEATPIIANILKFTAWYENTNLSIRNIFSAEPQYSETFKGFPKDYTQISVDVLLYHKAE